MNTILSVEKVEKYYGNKDNVTKAIDQISFKLIKDDLLVLWDHQEVEKQLY